MVYDRKGDCRNIGNASAWFVDSAIVHCSSRANIASFRSCDKVGHRQISNAKHGSWAVVDSQTSVGGRKWLEEAEILENAPDCAARESGDLRKSMLGLLLMCPDSSPVGVTFCLLRSY
jgi:hypothetical protein